MLKLFTENDLISSNQSGFKGASCVIQLVSFTHNIFGHKIRDVFLDISQAFDKVWHDGIIFKLTQNGISGNLRKLLRDFLSERRQSVLSSSSPHPPTSTHLQFTLPFTASPPPSISILFVRYFRDCYNQPDLIRYQVISFNPVLT